MATTEQSVPMITPSLIVKGAPEAIDFYTRVFGAEEALRMACPETGAVMHAELRFGSTRLYLCEEFPNHGLNGPSSLSGTPVSIHLQVADADAIFNKAVEAGATVAMPLADMFWGDRFGKLADPFGHHWSIASRIEELTPAQLRERMADSFAKKAC